MSPVGDLVRPEPDTQLRVQLPRSLLTFYARPGWPPNRSPPQSAGCTTATRCTRSLPEAVVRGRHGALKAANVAWRTSLQRIDFQATTNAPTTSTSRPRTT